MKHTHLLILFTVLMAACQPKPQPTTQPCAEALISYAQHYPESEPQDLYKLVFQDLYGPGHLLTDSAACAHYIQQEAQQMSDTTALPPYEYTLCDSHYVRINLLLVKQGTLSVGQLASATMRSIAPISPNPRFVLSHSTRFKSANQPHYRIISRQIFETELLPLLQPQP